MLQIPKTTTLVRRLGSTTLLAVLAALPGTAATPNASTLKTIYNFTGNADGAIPEAGVVLGSGGSLYGTTSSGGAHGWGTVWELIPNNGSWSLSVLYTFTGGADGAIPTSDLIIGPSNVLYGTTSYGGAHGFGTVFQVAPGTGGTWTEKVLYSFKGGATDGANPAAGLALASSTGVLYGTTFNGGTNNMGTVFQLGPSGSGTWSEKVLYSFLGGVDGANPLSDLVIGSGTVLYGATSQGGVVTNSSGTFSNWGVAYSLTPQGGGAWTEKVLYTFSGGPDGGTPESGLIIGPSGVLYGSTFWGGSPTVCPVGGYPQGCGTVYQLTPPSGSGPWTESVLHTFTGVSPDGAHPYRNMALNTTNVLFGTTLAGGAQTNYCFPQTYPGCGTIFNMKPPSTPGGPWTKSNITVFGGINGGAPNGIYLGTGGILYGTTVMGGASNGAGTVFSMAVGAAK